MNTITNGLLACLQQAKVAGVLDIQAFMAYMEPLYHQAGYRNRPALEKRLKILVSHDSGIGDFVNCSAALRELRRVYPQAEITLLIYPRCIELAQACPYIDHLLTNPRACRWDSPLELYTWALQFAGKYLLPHHFDMTFSFDLYGSSLLLEYMSGAPIRVGYSAGHIPLPLESPTMPAYPCCLCRSPTIMYMVCIPWTPT